MVETTQFPLTSLELRSLVTHDAMLRLSFVHVQITEPEGDELVVRVEGAPVNPSDLGLMLGSVPSNALRNSEDKMGRALTAPIPASTFARLAGRVGQSLPVGLEGMGSVISAGKDSQHLLGKKVAMIGGGMYAQFRKITPAECLVLPDGTSPEDGAGAFVNPMTSLSIVETMHREGHGALVHTAAASNLGQMLVRICLADGIELVNIVRSEEQVQRLKNIGAKFICNSSSPTFDNDLVDAVGETGATLAFDAVGGGDLASKILAAMEKTTGAKQGAYSRYGSNVRKQVYVYGGLDASPIILRKDCGMAWCVGGWLLFPFLERIGTTATEAMKSRVLRELKTTFASDFGRSVTLHDLLDPTTLLAADARSTGTKLLVEPHHG